VKLNSKYEITGKIQYVLTTPFKLITKYCLSNKGDIAIVVGDSNNKIHLYSLHDYRLKYCLESSHPLNRITNIAISRKNKFFSILYDDYNLEIYNLVEEQKINSDCECVNQLIEHKYDENNNNHNNKQNNQNLNNNNNSGGGLFSGKFFKNTFKKFKVTNKLNYSFIFKWKNLKTCMM